MALIKRKLTYAIKAPRNFGNRQNRIQKKRLFLFPDLQETVDAPVVLEFMKISQSILQNSTQHPQERKNINYLITTTTNLFY
jgi:hypothetical protein